jgi:hypothetical protein
MAPEKAVEDPLFFCAIFIHWGSKVPSAVVLTNDCGMDALVGQSHRATAFPFPGILICPVIQVPVHGSPDLPDPT